MRPREEQAPRSCSLPSPPFPWHLAVTHTSHAFPAHSRIKAFWEKNKRMQETEIGKKLEKGMEGMEG